MSDVERIVVEASPEVLAGWKQALQLQVTVDRNLFTCVELAELAGVGQTSMKARLKLMLKEGMCTREYAHRVDSAGRLVKMPVYRLVQKPAAKAGARKK